MWKSLILVVLLAGAADAEEIPLKEIWALDMPGTKSIEELEPKIYTTVKGVNGARSHDLLEKSWTTQFSKTLGSLKRGDQPGKGFAVSGTGLDALKNALAAREKPPESLPEGEVTLVFFSHSGGHVLIDRVTRAGNQFDIHYRVKVTNTMDLVKKLALIPIGELAKGEYDVRISCDKEGPASRGVCKSFSFTVE